MDNSYCIWNNTRPEGSKIPFFKSYVELYYLFITRYSRGVQRTRAKGLELLPIYRAIGLWGIHMVLGVTKIQINPFLVLSILKIRLQVSSQTWSNAMRDLNISSVTTNSNSTLICNVLQFTSYIYIHTWYMFYCKVPCTYFVAVFELKFREQSKCYLMYPMSLILGSHNFVRM